MIPLCTPQIEGNEWRYIKECLDTNWVSSAGAYVNQFEEQFSKYLKVGSACVVVNGTAALELALRVLGIKEGDEVIVPSLTFIAPVNAIRYVGAIPIFVDVCKDTFVMDAKRIESLITKRTKAIIPVHIYGNPCDMEKIMKIASVYNLYIIEDATESLGSLYNQQATGTIGHIGCFSFNGNKIITTGGGGMLVSGCSHYVKRAKHLSNQAKSQTDIPGAFYHEEIGYNYRMPNLLAAMGCAQLEKLPEYVDTKIKNANIYNELLKDKKGIILSRQTDNSVNCNWLYSVLIDNGYHRSRNELIAYLKQRGVEARPFFYPVHLMPHYSTYARDNMDITNELFEKGLNLPSSVGLKESEIEYICSCL